MPLYGQGGSSLPGAAPGQILGADQDGKPIWVDPDGKSPFRGAWAPDALKYSEGFGSGIVTPPYSTRVEAAGVQPSVSALVPAGQPYPASALVSANAASLANKSFLRLDLAALSIPNITRVMFWCRFIDAFSSFETYGNGRLRTQSAEIWSAGPTAGTGGRAAATWTKESVAVPGGAEYLEWHNGTGNGLTTNELLGMYVTGIEIYATDAPYMLGEFVTHAGEMWRSKVDFNSQTPAKASTAWEAVLALPNPSGTTAQRPTPAAAGLGFMYYDTSLSKPIWSDGAAWKDATGTAV